MRVSIVGLGKLGAPMAAVYASKGFEVIGVDKNQYFVDSLNKGIAAVNEPQLQEYIDRSKERLSATTNMRDAILKTDLTFIIVPTPSGSDGTFSNQYVLEAIQEIGEALSQKKDYHLIVVTSTVMPGSTGGIIQETLEKASGRKVGESLGLCYSPEFIALGSVIRDMLHPDFFLIGESDEKAGALLESIYAKACNNQPRFERMNFVNAELTKISVNTFVTTKISYANMLSGMCDYLPGADVNVVTQAVGCDRRIGHAYLRGAVAYGGPCFPRDNVAFSRLAQNLGARCDLSQATDVINRGQTQRLAEMVEKLGAKKVAILGLSYKPETPVIEESQGISLAIALSKKGVQVTVYDPMSLPPAQSVLGETVSYADSLEKAVAGQEALVIMTAWPEFKSLNNGMIPAEVPVIDCWRILDPGAVSQLIYLGTGFLSTTAKDSSQEASVHARVS